MRERRRDYELMFIISPLRSSEEDITTTVNRVQQAITVAGGEVTTTDQSAPWGRRKFAYPIREYAEGEASRRAFNEGYYVYLLTLVDTRVQATPPAAVALGADTGAVSEPSAEADAGEYEDEDIDTDKA